MRRQNCEAIFENGVFRPLTDLQLQEGESVQLIIESESTKNSRKKHWTATGIIARLTAHPIPIANFRPLTREEANERWWIDSCFIDSNIWLYRFIIDDRFGQAIAKQQIATRITNERNIVISTQVVNEICSNLIRKAGLKNPEIASLIQELAEGCEIVPVSLETLQCAVRLRESYSFSFWDSLIVASALLANAKILFSGDMQDGLEVNNRLQIVNPFKDLTS